MNVDKLMYDAIQRGATLKFVDTIAGSNKITDGVLQVEKENQFIQAVQEATVMLDASRYIGMKGSKRDIDRIEFDIDLEAATRNASTGAITLTDQHPTFAMNQLSAEKLMAKFELTYEALEDNIAQGSLESVLTSLFGSAVGRSLEKIFIFGDQDLTPGSNIPSGYAEINGWISKVDSGQVLYGGGTTSARDFDPTDIDDIFTKMYDALPANQLNEAKFMVPRSYESLYRRSLKSKDSPLGDQVVLQNGSLTFEGVPIVPVPALDIPVTNATFAANIAPVSLFLGKPTNFVHGLQRGITVESDKDIENQMYKFVASLRGDCHFENENNVVLAKPLTTAP